MRFESQSIRGFERDKVYCVFYLDLLVFRHEILLLAQSGLKLDALILNAVHIQQWRINLASVP